MTRKSDTTRRRILDATVELLAERGYTGTSTRQIAARAGVSEASIFKYYPSKDNLLMTIVTETIDEIYDYSMGEVVPEINRRFHDAPVEDAMRSAIAERLAFFEKNAKKIQVIYQETLVNPAVRKYFKEKVWRRMDELTASYVERGIERGELRGIDPFFVQRAIFGMLFHTTVFERVLGIDDRGYDHEKQAELMVSILMDGIRRQS